MELPPIYGEDSKLLYIRCAIHGQIKLPLYVKEVLNHPYVQRMRDIAQLGVAEYVFPGATHSRLSHLIGTAFVTYLICKQLLIPKEHEKLLVIAALLHDIGHAPFSHMYEQAGGSHHEIRTAKFIRIMGVDLPYIGVNATTLIDIINGHAPGDKHPYLYSIVANKDHGIDADKLDYLIRDCHYTGVKHNIDINRIIDGMIMLPNYKIGYLKKTENELVNVYRTRYELHERVYKHRVVLIISAMFIEIMKEEKLMDESKINWLIFTDSYVKMLRVFGGEKSKDIFKEIDSRKLWKYEETNEKFKYSVTIDTGYIGKIDTEKGGYLELMRKLPTQKIIKYLIYRNITHHI